MKTFISLVTLVSIFMITNTVHAQTQIGTEGLNLTPVPEPSTWMLMAAGAGAVILVKRLRNRSKCK